MNGTLAQVLAHQREKLVALGRTTSRELSARVIGRTPVDTGSLQASWTPNRGNPIARNVDTTGGNGGGMGRIDAVVRTVEPGDAFSLGNGKPYVRRIEFVGWSQRQAPQGMLRISVAEWEQIVNAEIASLR